MQRKSGLPWAICVVAALAGLATFLPSTPAVAANGDTAYVGGSITGLAVSGSHRAGQTTLWSAYDTGGGHLHNWDRNPIYFQRFDQQVIRQGKPGAVWLQLAFRDDLIRLYPTLQARVDLAQRVMAQIRARVGRVPIYVSAMAAYNPSGLCGYVAQAPALMQELAAALVASGAARRGPVLPTLTATQVGDGCHQNDAGQLVHGRVLQTFFPG